MKALEPKTHEDIAQGLAQGLPIYVAYGRVLKQIHDVTSLALPARQRLRKAGSKYLLHHPQIKARAAFLCEEQERLQRSQAIAIKQRIHEIAYEMEELGELKDAADLYLKLVRVIEPEEESQSSDQLVTEFIKAIQGETSDPSLPT